MIWEVRQKRTLIQSCTVSLSRILVMKVPNCILKQLLVGTSGAPGWGKMSDKVGFSVFLFRVYLRFSGILWLRV